MPHVEADYFLQLAPGTNVALFNAMAHASSPRGWPTSNFINERCDAKEYAAWREFIAEPVNSPEATEKITGVAAAEVRARRAALCQRAELGDLLRSRRDRA